MGAGKQIPLAGGKSPEAAPGGLPPVGRGVYQHMVTTPVSSNVVALSRQGNQASLVETFPLGVQENNHG